MLGRGGHADLLPRYTQVSASSSGDGRSRATHYSKVDKPMTMRRLIASAQRHRVRVIAATAMTSLLILLVIMWASSGSTPAAVPEEKPKSISELDLNALLKAAKQIPVAADDTRKPEKPHPAADAVKKQPPVPAAKRAGPGIAKPSNADTDKLESIKQEFLHAWGAYKRDAWGMDDLHPVSKRGTNGYRMGLTLIDSLDTIVIMGLDKEYEECRAWVNSSLFFTDQQDVNVFETTIRVMGGLLSTYALKKDPMFLEKARQLADKLLIAFDTRSGIPFGTVSFQPNRAYNPSWGGGASSTSEAGTVQMEWRYLSKLTGSPVYAAAVDRATTALKAMAKPKGLFTRFIDPDAGTLVDQTITLGARVDSIYEYFLKQWLQSGKTDQAMYELYTSHVDAINRELLQYSMPNKLAFYRELINNAPRDKMDHLVCFMSGMLALGAANANPPGSRQSEMEIGKQITETCAKAYFTTPTGLSPEIFLFNENGKDMIVDPNSRHNLLRPETVESLFILWRLTHDQKYRDWGWKIFESFRRHCRVPSGGYSSLRDVLVTDNERNWSDHMESFFLGETLKYFYLLFSDDDVLPLDKWVFNTEAHPFPINP
ncbi:unnamed protein product (mitochondrion) [Plasmodiophora brassicae]|uniref:alpha-1,2-Mannosidase n=1 Tax=Plasmodiophora brassicae TaxID=37360 RepID=A0A3P3YEM8_PLABS|nr:unnamed protein product [Plasmodiophora brassicae]